MKERKRISFFKIPLELSTVVYTYKPSYLGGRDREDYGLRPAWAKC
jgi:hypothetical protein